MHLIRIGRCGVGAFAIATDTVSIYWIRHFTVSMCGTIALKDGGGVKAVSLGIPSTEIFDSIVTPTYVTHCDWYFKI